ncbi:ABC transporter substrate-binding protein [Halovenus marina]|uniref:ABC transporter substrate-binding protein n=1 Tax=Halovenus marina TaxID=3396621 RepID=UPI003F555DD5
MQHDSQRARRNVELAHHYVGGDGASALAALLDGYEGSADFTVDETQYDNLRLQVKSRILMEDPPDIWTGFPGGETRRYDEAGVVADIDDIWAQSGLESAYLPEVADTARIDGTYRAVPVTVQRLNNLFVNVKTAREGEFEPGTASDPTELVEQLQAYADRTGKPGILLPMANPFTVLQVWELTLLGLSDAATFRDVTGGNADRHRNVIQSALDHVVEFAELAPDGALYRDLTDANQEFMNGGAPVYPQGDWAAGVFVDTDGFTYGEDWTQVPFPGTEGEYVMVLDAFIPSASADVDAVRPFLEYAGSAEGQRRFSREKGSLPVRSDASMRGFSSYGQDQKTAFDSADERIETITHGLSVSPEQLVDLKAAITNLMNTWDTDAVADEIVAIF